MIVRLCDAVVGDRFVAVTGIAWTVLSNVNGYVKLVSDHKQPHEGQAPPMLWIDVTNRDPNLTDAGALSNLMNGGITGQVVSIE